MPSATLLLILGTSTMLLSHCLSAQKPTQEEIAKNITHILDTLVDPKLYDKRLRPNYGGEPVNVGITIYVSSISAVSEVAMDYTLDIYLRQSWTDPRLAFTSYVEEITIDVNYQKAIWVPDTFFPNEKQSYFHVATTHNSFLRIDAKGNVRTSQRITVTATCPMHLQLFPLDSQECTLEIESYGYSTSDISYDWDTKAAKQVFSMSENVSLPQFRIAHLFVGKVVEQLSTGDYSRLKGRFIFTRQLGFYIIQIYLPSNLIVIISWVSFWLSREASPARVALGVTTVLTMTTLMTTTNSAMPKVSYVKTVDVYLGTCFFMVFASLLEYAAVVYLNKVLRRRKDLVQQNKNANTKMAAAFSTVSSYKRFDAAGQRLFIPGMPADQELIVIISWVSFWLSRDATPARVALGVLTVLTMTTLMTTTNSALPKVSYIKSIDIYLITCYSMVFAALLEYAAVCYLSKIMKRRKEKRVQIACKASEHEAPGHADAAAALTQDIRHRNQFLPVEASAAFLDKSASTKDTSLTPDYSPKLCTCALEKKQRKKLVSFHKKRSKSMSDLAVTPSGVDKYSRMVFPIGFAVFNGLYWGIYLKISNYADSETAR